MSGYIIEKSFQIIRTNPALTTNYKIVVDSNYDIYLESFDTNKQLSDYSYKHFPINKENYLEDKITVFYNGLPINLAFDVKYDNDDNLMYKDYSYQFDDIYFSGANEVEDTWYEEEFEYFAPLYIRPDNLPSAFIILRVDYPTVYDFVNQTFALGTVSKDNFRTEILDNWKCVKVVDMTYDTNLGYWLNKNFVTNPRFPQSPFEFDVKNYNFSRWWGIDYNTGVYTHKDLFLVDELYYEQPHFRLEQFITNSYEANGIIFPNILNFKFLYDDTPATPFGLNQYSINRYYGYYIDQLEYIKDITTYEPPSLRTDISLQIINNVFMSTTQISGSTCPYTVWDNSIQHYVYAKGTLHKVAVTIDNIGNTYYKIISDQNISISDISTDGLCTIQFQCSGTSYINNISGTTNSFIIDPYYTPYGQYSDMYADLYLILIDGKYHVLKCNTSIIGTGFTYFIQTDYAIESDGNTLQYWINNQSSGDYTQKSIIDPANIVKPLTYPVYRLQFLDIKDFDFDRVHTHYSDFDYEKNPVYYPTQEEKLYATEYRDNSSPKQFKQMDDGSTWRYSPMNVSSEYIADDELWEVNVNDLTPIWRKNPYVCKWGYMGSISHCDYPYKLNNSMNVGSIHNRSVDIFTHFPEVLSKNLDYAYRVGSFHNSAWIPGSSANTYFYYNQSTNIQTEEMNSDSIFFNLDYYILSWFDYFDYFFRNDMIILNNQQQYSTTYTKYSVFTNGNVYNPSMTLFKGLKINLMKVKDMVRNEANNIEQFVWDNNTNYNNYRCSIIYNFEYLTGVTSYYSQSVISTLTGTAINWQENSIHIFLNDVFKNLLVFVNINLSIGSEHDDLNNFDLYGEKYGFYNGYYLNGLSIPSYNPNLLTAQNVINAINDLNNLYGFDNFVTYHYIDPKGNYGHFRLSGTTIDSTMNTIPGWGHDFSPYIIDIDYPDTLTLKKNSYTVSAVKGPKYNIYDKYKLDFTEVPYNKATIVDPLSRFIQTNETELNPRPQQHGETLNYTKDIYRYSGPYEPIFKDMIIFDNYFYSVVPVDASGNTSFSASFTWTPSSVSQLFGQYYFYGTEFGWNFNSSTNIFAVTGVTGYSQVAYLFGFSGWQYIPPSSIVPIGFWSVIPPTAIINGVIVNIDESATAKSSVQDYIIQLTGTTIASNNYAVLANTWPYPYWNTYTYGSPSDTWGIPLTVSDINDLNFGINVQVKFTTGGLPSVTAYMKNITITVYYTVPGFTGTYVSFSPRNTRFNDSSISFGKLEELVCTKVNPDGNVLKIQNTETDRSVYPMCDEFGYQYVDRFIFKSTWDSEFYIQTLNDWYNLR
jgi:hypothetical protein